MIKAIIIDDEVHCIDTVTFNRKRRSYGVRIDGLYELSFE